MSASLLLPPPWTDPLMFLFDGGPEERGGTMDAFPPNQCGSLRAHPASLASGGGCAAGELLGSDPGGPGKQGSPCPAAQSVSAASLPYGFFGSGYYPCGVAPGGGKARAQPPSAYGDPAAPGEDFSPRTKDFSFYPGYPAAPYQPPYLDVGAPPEPRPVEPPPPWSLSTGWSGQVYRAAEPPAPAPRWSPASPGRSRDRRTLTARNEERCVKQLWSPPAETLCAGDASLRRGRKKRVPYSKVQLKELEREFAASRFITKDRRRTISGQTRLTERQVTIWFQNRRVKEKKLVSKFKSCS